MEQDYDYLFRRRHALHRENREVWERSRAAYYGGEAYIRRALVRHNEFALGNDERYPFERVTLRA